MELKGFDEKARQPSPAGTAVSKRQGLALCLSGGGFRATLFHLGAARRLHELGLLQRLDTISSVSGGSIFAGLLADLAVREIWRDGLAIHNFEVEVAEPVRALTRRDLRTVPFLTHLLWNWLMPGPRARHLERLYGKRISSTCLRDLPDRPRFVFCATDILFGISWESSRERTGSYQAGYLVNGAEWPLARAVAASACFPPIFGPLPVDMAAVGFRRSRFHSAAGNRLRSRLALSDGGVYDNMGLEPVWRTHACILVSDCGAPFDFRISSNPVRRLTRYTRVIMNQAQSLRRRMFFADVNAGTYMGTYWSISTGSSDEKLGYSGALVDERISQIRTDLDPFTDAEQYILENHGYWVADQRLRKRLPHLLPQDAVEPVAPHPVWMDEGRAREALRSSHRRVSPKRMLLRR